MSLGSQRIAAILARTPVVPVVTIDHLDQAVPLANALIEGGLTVIEVTLRTPVALAAIAEIHRKAPLAVVGAGTVLTPEQLERAEEAGAAFAVAPGHAPRLLAGALTSGVPLLPGAVTASEMMRLLEEGYSYQKFFPAEPAGGVAVLKAVAAPLPEIRFCPTGGIDEAKAPSYLALSNVICVGGSWMLPKDLVAAHDWRGISEIAERAGNLAKRGA